MDNDKTHCIYKITNLHKLSDEDWKLHVYKNYKQ